MADLANATVYIQGMISPAATRWLALTTTQQTQTLVSATRMFEVVAWQGKATGAVLPGNTEALAWPRSGIVIDGVAVDDTTVPRDIIRGTYELAVAIGADNALPTKRDTGSNIKSVGGAGVPTVEFWSPTSAAAGTATQLPVQVQALVGKYMAIAAPSTVTLGSGGSSCAPIGNLDGRYRLTRPQ